MVDNFLNSKNNQRGQVLLIVILVMVVALTIGLSVATKSITSLRTSTEQAESQKALSAAEAGIEQAIKANAAPPSSSLGSASYVTTLSKVDGSSFLLNGGNAVPKNDGIDLWLSDYSTDSAKIYQNQWDGNVTIYWGVDSGGCNDAALEIAVVYGTKAAPLLTRYAVDACQNRRSSNSFASAAGLGTVNDPNKGSVGFQHSVVISVTSGFFMRIIPIYGNAEIGVTATDSGNNPKSLPEQGKIITSTGSSGSTARKVTVFQSFPSLPTEFFPYDLFSP